MTRRPLTAPLLAMALLASTACATARPMPTVAHVDLPRFMGDWYVIASIPTALEKGAHNAIESYRLAPDGTIETTFTFRQGDFDGPQKRYTPRGFVVPDGTNATWGMRFVWPFKSEFLIVHLDEGYQTTVIGRTDRDYVWIMARKPAIPEEELARLTARLVELGYDVSRLARVPQRWPSPPAEPAAPAPATG